MPRICSPRQTPADDPRASSKQAPLSLSHPLHCAAQAAAAQAAQGLARPVGTPPPPPRRPPSLARPRSPPPRCACGRWPPPARPRPHRPGCQGRPAARGAAIAVELSTHMMRCSSPGRQAHHCGRQQARVPTLAPLPSRCEYFCRNLGTWRWKVRSWPALCRVCRPWSEHSGGLARPQQPCSDHGGGRQARKQQGVRARPAAGACWQSCNTCPHSTLPAETTHTCDPPEPPPVLLFWLNCMRSSLSVSYECRMGTS